ncbi:protein PIH1D3-like isoform X2 [Anneissia japonica]|uniref:protein PIH1D3-like isoform X2 n=1 Tax=Anneissia japonica TaxID=1529436 RepID=UPI001425706E|nr:protein PIH1D3-like isoform X2 [Anneissia japonica]
METSLGLAGITALSELLKPPGSGDSDGDEDKPVSRTAQQGPGSIGPPKKPPTAAKDSTPATKKNSKDIWDVEEVQEGAEYDDVDDPRPQPEYEIIFKQKVATEDMFLGMGNKTNATSSCEDIVVKITLPDTKYSEVTLDVNDKYLSCATPNYKLGLHLPHPVDSKNGQAKWDAANTLLTVTMPMKREYDFLNF